MQIRTKVFGNITALGSFLAEKLAHKTAPDWSGADWLDTAVAGYEKPEAQVPHISR